MISKLWSTFFPGQPGTQDAESPIQGPPSFIQTYLPLALAFAPVLLLFEFVHRFGVNLIRYDEWANVDAYRMILTGNMNWWALLASHNNEHHEFFKVILEFAIEHLTHFNMKVSMYFAICFQVGAFILLVGPAIRIFPNRRFSLWLLIPLGIVMASLSQYIDALWALGIAWYMITFCLFLMLYLLSFTGAGTGETDRWTFLGLAATASVIASFCAADGLLVWPAGWVFLWLRSESFTAPWRNKKLIVWTFLSVAVGLFYVITLGVGTIGSGEGQRPQDLLQSILGKPFLSLEFFAANVGAVFISQPAGRVIPAGFAILAAAIWGCTRIARSSKRASYAFPAALMIFGLLHVGLLLLGRLHSGIDESISGAYAYYRTFTLPLILGIYLTCVHRESLKGLSRTGRVLLGVLCASFFILFTVNNSYWGIVRAAEIRVDRWAAVAMLVDYRHQSPLVIERLITNEPPAAKFYSQVGYLEQNQMSVFASGQAEIPLDVRARIQPPADWLAFAQSNPEYRSALQRLWEVYIVSPDLKGAFDPTLPDFSRNLILWTKAEAVSKGYYLHPLLEPFAHDYVSLPVEALGKPARPLPLEFAAFVKGHPGDEGALGRLWEFYLSRGDLQKAFNADSPGFTHNLVLWASGAANGSNPESMLKEFGKKYVELLSEAEMIDAPLRQPPPVFLDFENANMDQQAALDRLWIFYLSRGDLQKAFKPGAPDFMKNLLTWAYGASRSNPPEPHLLRFKDAYEVLLSEIAIPETTRVAPAAYTAFANKTPVRLKALERLWRFYLTRGDLQNAFHTDSPKFTRDMMVWASGAAYGKPPEPYLAKFGQEYRDAAAELTK